MVTICLGHNVFKVVKVLIQYSVNVWELESTLEYITIV